jgi:hypothetical protein
MAMIEAATQLPAIHDWAADRALLVWLLDVMATPSSMANLR